MEKISLSEIAKAVNGKMINIKDDSKTINEISTDTRALPNGCLFWVLKGANFDAHDFVKMATENGAIAAVTEKEIEGCPCIVVNDTAKMFREFSGYYRDKFKPFLVGVTGSVGKTTTKEFTALVLSEKYNTLKTEGNFNNEIGLPKTLLRLDKSFEAAVIEMGMSDFGEIDRLSRTAKPDIAVITNIGFSHIEKLHSQEGILKAKLEILNGMKSNAPLVINADDRFLSLLKVSMTDREVISYGIKNHNADCRAVDIAENDGKCSFTICFKGEKIAAELPCIGIHNVMNALAAFCIGIKAGLTPQMIVSALKKYKGNQLRQNIVQKDGQIIIIDCYNASPDSMKAALYVLSTVDNKNTHRRIAVLGDMLELGELSPQLHEVVGEEAANSSIDKIFCCGKEALHISAKAKKLGADTYFTENPDELCGELESYLKKGDIVLFKASRGMKFEKIIEKIYGSTVSELSCQKN